MKRSLVEGVIDSLVEGRQTLNEACGADICDASPMKERSSKVKQTRVQYIQSENSYRPVGAINLVPKMQPGAYDISVDMQGPIFHLREAVTDELYMFENSKMTEVAREIKRFWTLKENFTKLGFLHNRGILMYGPPGTGKSSVIHQVAEAMSKQGDVMFVASQVGSVIECMTAFRDVEPERRVVVVLEDMDEYVGYSERSLLQLLDGQNSQTNVLYLGTTNYISKFPPRLLRPGRFDKKIEIGFPPVEGRRVYLQHKLKGIAEERMIEQLAQQTEGFSFGHLREMLLGVFAFQEPVDEVLERLRDINYQELPKRETGVLESILPKKRSVLKG